MKLVTPYKYAKLCGVSPQAIALRIMRKTLPVVEHTNPDGSVSQYVDVDANPPVRFDAGRNIIENEANKK